MGRVAKRKRGSGDGRSKQLPRVFVEMCLSIAKKHRTSSQKGKNGPPAVPVSLSPMIGLQCACVEVDVAQVAVFLNEVGQESRKRRTPDVQLWLQKRTRKTADKKVEIWGVVLDVDEKLCDPLATLREAGIPTPTAWWQTQNGCKAAFCFDRRVDEKTFQRIAKQLTIAVPGGDPGSWSVTQGQHLPICLKSCSDGIQDVNLPAQQSNGQPLSVAELEPQLPVRIERFLSAGRTLSTDERVMVEEYLSELGIPAPEQPGESICYASCPDCDSHDSSCCYVNRRDTGAIVVTCLGGHAGEGKKVWHELHLYERVTGTSLPTATVDAVRDIPVTWAGEAFIDHKLVKAMSSRPFWEAHAKAAKQIWQAARARHEASAYDREQSELLKREPGAVPGSPPPAAEYLHVYQSRLAGCDVAGPFDVFYDEIYRCLSNGGGGDVAMPIRTRSESLSMSAYAHEWRATNGYRIMPVVKKVEEAKFIIPEVTFDKHYASHWNKALAGHSGGLTALGLPRIIRYELPVAFVRNDWAIDSKTKHITAVRTASVLHRNPSFDTIRFFTRLFEQGRLPLAAQDDVARYVIAIAAPLLRHIAAGLLGIYWVMGPSGAGKDYLAEIIPDIWQLSTPHAGKVKFDVNLTDDLELKRSFYAAGQAIYGRAKEAGKRRNMVDLLIRLGGTDQVTARGMHRDEIEVRNTFTYLADSVENLPERKEISRRTVIINVAPIDELVSKGEVIREIRACAPDIIADLKALVESRPAEWYLNQSNTGARPLIPVALARLFGVELPEVQARNLDELFEAMHEYVDKDLCGDEGTKQRAGARDKDGKEMKELSSYRLSHFIETMREQVGYKALFHEISSARLVELWLQRETAYVDVLRHQLPYLRVEIRGTPHAFKLVKCRRNFILEPELVYCSKVGVHPISQPACNRAIGDASPEEKRPARRDDDIKRSPRRFSEAELLGADEPSSDVG
ncbi:hypothetical protein ACFL6C_09940 [Myxococcota bacterium]